MDQANYRLAVSLRHELHSHPELSMEERWTKARLMDFLRQHTHLELADRGAWFYAVCRGGADEPAVAFRAELDAIPVDEAPGLVPYVSRFAGVGHKCGHDGHCAALAALALELERRGSARTVCLLFQHAEETGQGAAQCAALLEEVPIAEIYAFHNFPGLPLGAAAVPEGAVQPASTGMILRFSGTKAHASYPEDGKNPAYAVAEVVTALPALTRPGLYRGLALVTVVQVNVGERAFGVSAGEGELLLTVRGEHQSELERLCGAIEALAGERSAAHGLGLRIDYEDTFPETYNHPACAARARSAAGRLGIPVVEMGELFRASEDFGRYTGRIPGAMIYLGAGDCPPLHTPEYDFPDPLIATAADLFLELAR